MKKSNKKSLIKLVIGCAVILLAVGLGYVFRARLFHPVASSVVPQHPNWFVVLTFMLIFVGFVVMGYLTEWKFKK